MATENERSVSNIPAIPFALYVSLTCLMRCLWVTLINTQGLPGVLRFIKHTFRGVGLGVQIFECTIFLYHGTASVRRRWMNTFTHLYPQSEPVIYVTIVKLSWFTLVSASSEDFCNLHVVVCEQYGKLSCLKVKSMLLSHILGGNVFSVQYTMQGKSAKNFLRCTIYYFYQLFSWFHFCIFQELCPSFKYIFFIYISLLNCKRKYDFHGTSLTPRIYIILHFVLI